MNRNLKNERSTSVYPGVDWEKRRERWRARIRIEGKQRHLGLFVNELEAAYTYYQAARERHPHLQFAAWEASAFQEFLLRQQFSSLNV
jgi:hypothetical protein